MCVLVFADHNSNRIMRKTWNIFIWLKESPSFSLALLCHLYARFSLTSKSLSQILLSLTFPTKYWLYWKSWEKILKMKDILLWKYTYLTLFHWGTFIIWPSDLYPSENPSIEPKFTCFCYWVWHGLRLMKRDDYFQVGFDHFKSEIPFLRQQWKLVQV
jgi:hypothetical protein